MYFRYTLSKALKYVVFMHLERRLKFQPAFVFTFVFDTDTYILRIFTLHLQQPYIRQANAGRHHLPKRAVRRDITVAEEAEYD